MSDCGCGAPAPWKMISGYAELGLTFTPYCDVCWDVEEERQEAAGAARRAARHARLVPSSAPGPLFLRTASEPKAEPEPGSGAP